MEPGAVPGPVGSGLEEVLEGVEALGGETAAEGGPSLWTVHLLWDGPGGLLHLGTQAKCHLNFYIEENCKPKTYNFFNAI